MDYNINLKGGGAAIGAAAGAATGGVQGMILGTALGYILASHAINGARRSVDATSIHMSRHENREMRFALDLANVAIWGAQPLIQADDYIGNQLRRRIYDDVVDPYGNTVSPYVHDVLAYTQAMTLSYCIPENAFRRVRAKLGPRLGRKAQKELYGLALITLRAVAEYGNINEQREWFATWCGKIGIGGAEDGLWNEVFGDSEPMSMAEFLHWRHEHAMDLYDADVD